MFDGYGYPNAAAKVDGDWIDVDAYEDVTYSYTTVAGAPGRVRQYVVLKAY